MQATGRPFTDEAQLTMAWLGITSKAQAVSPAWCKPAHHTLRREPFAIAHLAFMKAQPTAGI